MQQTSTPEYLYSELPAIQLLTRLGYTHCNASGPGGDERSDIGEVILEKRFLAALKRINPWIDKDNLNAVLSKIKHISSSSLMEANQTFWQRLKGSELSVTQVIDGREEHPLLWLIDYQNPANNDFLVVSQMKFRGRAQHSVPDLVLFVNGLPLAVIECKSPLTSGAWNKAFNDLEFYQKNSEKLFYYNQICAGVWQVGGRYGAIATPRTFYSYLKTEASAELMALTDGAPTEQDKLIYQLFKPEHLLDLVRHFVLFELDEGRVIKKLPRYQQLRATQKTIARLRTQDKGGVIWHTQGSGKSLTMAYIVRKLQAPEYGFDNPTILILTDRKDLDLQITATFRAVGFKNVYHAGSVDELARLLRNDYGSIITSTLQKFQESKNSGEEGDELNLSEEDTYRRVEKSVKDGVLTRVVKVREGQGWVEVSREEIVLEKLSEKKNLYVLVDEAHRSQYGFLAAFMRNALPHAKFVAFTGTPISKEDKSTLAEFYGGDYLDKYTIKESVEDSATVELFYDEGIARLDVKAEALDREFEEQFGHGSEEKKARLKSEALRRYQLSGERITAICRHLLDHYKNKIYPDGHKAMIVCAGREAALRYQQTLLSLKEQGEHSFESKVVVSLGSPKSDELARAHYETLDWNRQHPDRTRPVLLTPVEQVRQVADDFRLPFGDESELEKSGKKKYDNTALLIVSDMLLTGYDVPIASCLYLDKPLKEHNLLQAIARVNRARDGKVAGYVVDYNGISGNLIRALEIYSGDVKPEDILRNINEEIPRLALHHHQLVQFFKSLKFDRQHQRAAFLDVALRFLEPLHLRDGFRDLLRKFNRSLNIVLPDKAALKYRDDFALFNELKLRARNAYPDDEDLSISREESRLLQQLIDEHLTSEGVYQLLARPVSIIDRERFNAETLNASSETKALKMRNQLSYHIRVGLDRNPDFFRPLAERLAELLREYEAQRLSQAQLLLQFASMQEDIINENKAGREKGFTTAWELAVFNTMQLIFAAEAPAVTHELFRDIEGELNIVDWQHKKVVQKDIENKIVRLLSQKLDREEAKEKAKELVEVIKKNKNA